MFKALYSHVSNIIDKYLQIYNHILLYLQWLKKRKKLKLKQLLNHLIRKDKKKEKLKLTQYIQIYKNNDLLLLNLVNKYVLSDLLKLGMVLDFWIS